MFSYIRQHLGSHEKLIYFGKPHWAIYMASVVYLLIALLLLLFGGRFLPTDFITLLGWPFNQVAAIIFLLCALLKALASFLYYLGTEFAISNKRVLIKQGLLRRVTHEVLLHRIESVSLQQGIIARLLHYGRLHVLGTGGSFASFPYIAQPQAFRQALQQAITSARRQQSDHAEAD